VRDRPTDHATRSVTRDPIYARIARVMRSNNMKVVSLTLDGWSGTVGNDGINSTNVTAVSVPTAHCCVTKHEVVRGR